MMRMSSNIITYNNNNNDASLASDYDKNCKQCSQIVKTVIQIVTNFTKTN